MSADGPRVCLTFDFDAISIWPAAFGLTTPTALSRGEFGARVAVPRILDSLRAGGVPATFFIPGHTVETFPDVCRRIVEEGHEVGHHGWMHESPLSLDQAAERAVLERGIDSIERVLGVRPAGYRSPSWDLTPHSIPLLRELGFAYDSSMMAQDLEMYRVREGDVLHMDRPFEFGREVDLVEVPVSWSLDDFPHLEFVPAQGFLLPAAGSPQALLAGWTADLDFMVDRVPGGVFTMTFHPQAIGRGARLLLLEGLIAHAAGRGARFLRVSDAVAEWRTANPFAS